MGKGQASADRDLGADNTVATVKALGEHVHGAALSVGDTLTAAEKLADNGSDRAATHHGETVASVGSDDVVLLGDGMLDTNSNGLLTGRQVAETADLLLLVQAIGSHLHLSERLLVLSTAGGSGGASCCIPDGDHLVVHLLQLLLGHLNRVGRRVQLVGLEALVAEGDLEGLIIGLYRMAVSRLFHNAFHSHWPAKWNPQIQSIALPHIPRGQRKKRIEHTLGTDWFRDAEAASVVTDRAATAKAAGALVRRGRARGTRRAALENIATAGVSGKFCGGNWRGRWQKSLSKLTSFRNFAVLRLEV